MPIDEQELRRIAGKIVKRGATPQLMLSHPQHVVEICGAFLELASNAGVDDPNKPARDSGDEQPAPKRKPAAKKAARK